LGDGVLNQLERDRPSLAGLLLIFSIATDAKGDIETFVGLASFATVYAASHDELDGAGHFWCMTQHSHKVLHKFFVFSECPARDRREQKIDVRTELARLAEDLVFNIHFPTDPCVTFSGFEARVALISPT